MVPGDAAVVVGRGLRPAVRPDKRRSLPYEPAERFIEAGDARVERAELERPIDVLANGVHDVRAVATPLVARERGDSLDDPVASR